MQENVAVKETKKEKVADTKNVQMEYKKVSEMSVEEIKTLSTYPVTFRRVKGDNYESFSLSITLCSEFVIKKKIQASDFYYFVNAVAVPKLKLVDNLDIYTVKAPVRFCKGIGISKETGEEFEYLSVQAIIQRDAIYSSYVNKKNHELQLFETLIEAGKIKKPDYVYIPKKVGTDSEELLVSFEE